MANMASPSGFFFPYSAEKKNDDHKPIENPLLSNRNNNSARISPHMSTTTIRRSPAGTPLSPLNNNLDGLRLRKQPPQEKEQQSGFVPPPRESYSLGFGVDTFQQMESPPVQQRSVAPVLSPLAVTSPSQLQHASASATLGSWILVYGYATSSQYDEILRQFMAFGLVLDHRGSCQPGLSNWIAIRYSSRLEVEKALCHQHFQLVDGIFCGVKRLQDNDPILLQAQQQPALSSLWGQNKSANTTNAPPIAAPANWSGSNNIVLANNNREDDILLAPNRPRVPKKRGICENFARWLLAIED